MKAALQKHSFGLTHRTESHICLALACGATTSILHASICSLCWFFFSTTLKMGTVSSSLLPSPSHPKALLTSMPVGSLPTWVARNQVKEIFSVVLQLWRTIWQRWKAQWYQSHLYADFFVAVYWFVFPNADLEFSAPFAGEEKWYQKEGMQLTTAIQPSHRERGRKEMQIVLQDPHSNASWNSSKNVGPFKQVLKESKFIALLFFFFFCTYFPAH